MKPTVEKRWCSRCGDELDQYQTRCDDECATGASTHFICGGEPTTTMPERFRRALEATDDE